MIEFGTSLHIHRGHFSNSDSISRGSHLYVLCRSVRDRDQNWIKWSRSSWGGGDQGTRCHEINSIATRSTLMRSTCHKINSMTSKLLKINNEERMTAMWHSTPGNQAIKSLRREWSSTLCWSKNLMRSQTLLHIHIGDYPSVYATLVKVSLQLGPSWDMKYMYSPLGHYLLHTVIRFFFFV